MQAVKGITKTGESVIGYTYNDDKLGIDLVSQYNKTNPKVVLLDRYDMYNGMFREQIADWAKYSIILIDCKDDLNVDYDADWCYIEMSPAGIEVTQ